MMENMKDMVDENTTIDWVHAAQQVVRDYCGWHVAPVITEVLKLTPNDAHILDLPSLRVIDIRSFKILGVEHVADIRWDASGFVESKPCLPLCASSVEVMLKHGFTEVPELVVLIHQLAKRAANAPAGNIRSQSVNGASVAYGAASGEGIAAMSLFQGEKAVLERYRLGRIP